MDTISTAFKKMERKKKLAQKSPRFSKIATAIFGVSAVIATAVWWPNETNDALGKSLLFTWIVILGLLTVLVYTNLRTTLLLVKIVRPLQALALIFSILMCVHLGSIGYFTGGVAAGILLAGIPYIIFTKTFDKFIGFGNVRVAMFAGILLGFRLSMLCLLIILLSYLSMYLYKVLAGSYSKKKRLIDSSEVGLMWGVAVLICMIFGQRIL